MMIDKLKILGHEYTVGICDEIMPDTGNFAEIIFKKCQIVISSHVSQSKKEEGLIHEIVEALNYHFEMDLPHPKIMQLSEGLYQVLKDNGLLKIP